MYDVCSTTLKCSLVPVRPSHEVGKDAVTRTLVATQSALVVRLHLGVRLGDELGDPLQPHHWVDGGTDPLVESHGNLHQVILDTCHILREESWQ